MEDKPSIRKNFAFSTLYQIILILVSFISASYLSRVLGADMIGIQSYTESIQAYFLLFATLGTSTYGAREITQHRNNIYIRSKLFWEIELMTVITSFIVLILWLIFIAVSSRYQLYYIAMIPHIIASMFDISWFFRGLEKFNITATYSSAFLILEFILIILFVRRKTDLLYYIIILSVIKLLTSISLWKHLKKYIVKIELKEISIKKHFRQTLIYFIPTIATSIYTIFDRTLIGFFAQDFTQNGYYIQAEKILVIAKNVSYASINLVVGVRISFLFVEEKFNEIKERIRESINYILFMGVGCACGIVTIAHNFVLLFLGNEFLEVEFLLYVLSPIVVIIGISNCLETHYYTPSGKKIQSTRYLIIGSCFNLLLNLVFIPKFYAFGAAIASVSAELLIAFLLIIKCDRYLSLKCLILDAWKKIVSGILMIIIVCPIGFFYININKMLLVLIQIIFGICIYLIALFLLDDSWVKAKIYIVISILNKSKK
ncbi:MAG: oligosaccharide flippase family protein [Lachnospiraceae bacterium]|nr:oligosaccharide flippase family protein [Lachnospiraceae bacterium]